VMWDWGGATSGTNAQLGSPAVDPWAWLSRMRRRRAVAAEQWWCGRGCSNSSEVRACSK
jgi:ribosomal 50S subunit-recycling heat shock protein